LPYLRTKREQAIIAIGFQSHKAHGGHGNDELYYIWEEVEREKMGRLNQRGLYV